MYSERMSASTSRNSFRGFLSLTICFLILAATAAGQEPAVNIRPARDGTLEAKSRAAVGIALFIENLSGIERNVQTDIILPPGWRSLAPTAVVPIADGASDLQIIPVLIPSNARAGSYTILCLALDAIDGSTLAACDFPVDVLPAVSLEVRRLESPPFVLAGDSYLASFILTNNGNVRTKVELSVTSASGWPYEIVEGDGRSVMSLDAGEIRVVKIRVWTPAALNRSTRHSLQLALRPLESDTLPDLTASAKPAVTIGYVEIVPLTVDDRQIRRYLNGNLETGVSGGYDEVFSGSLSQSLELQGSLDERGEHDIEVDIQKTLDTSYAALFTPHDKYSVRYAGPLGDLYLGDHPFTLSPLLLMNRMGRGAGARLDFRPFTAKVLYYTDPWSTSPDQGVGASLDFMVPRTGDLEEASYRVALSGLSPLSDRVGFSLFQRYAPTQNLEFELDLAMQSDSARPFVPAVFGWTSGDLGLFYWNGKYLQVWPGFGSTKADVLSFMANGGFRLMDGGLVLNTGFSWEAEKPSLYSQLSSAPSSTKIALGTGGKIPSLDTRLRLDWELWRRLNPSASPAVDTYSHIFRANFNQPLGDFSLALSSIVDIGVDQLAGKNYVKQDHLMDVGWKPDPDSKYGLTLQYSAKWNSSENARHLAGWTVGAQWKLGGAQIEGQAKNLNEFVGSDYSGFLGGIKTKIAAEFPWSHVLSFEGSFWLQWAAGKTTADASASLNYRIPIQLPIGQKSDIAIIAGRVYDLGTDQGLPGVILRLNGLAAISDEKGLFTFYVPHSGSMYFQIDQSTLELGMLPVEKMPLKVESPPGGRTFIEIGITRACQVSGNAGVYGFPTKSGAFSMAGQGAELSESADRIRLSDLGGLVMELDDGMEQQRRVTNENGDFSFKDLKPGLYTLRVAGGRIPDLHRVDPVSIELVLAPGDARTVEFRAVEERRVIKMIDLSNLPTLEIGGDPQAAEAAIP